MSLPPVALAVLVLDACGWALLLPAAWTSLRILASWTPATASSGQLELERRAEASSPLGRAAVALFGAASLVLLVGFLLSLPRIVPGAMCAAGVLEALPGGRTMIGLRLATALAAVVWARLDALNRRAPLAPLAEASARALLVLAAIAAVASWRTGAALFGLELDRTVSCCTVLYDLAAMHSPPALTDWLAADKAAAGTALTGLLAAGLARRVGRQPTVHGGWLVGLALATAAWIGLGSVAVVNWAGPYVTGAVGHRCPFCLFLPVHGGYGFAVWSALALAGRESAVLITTAAVVRAEPELRSGNTCGTRRSAVRLAVLALAVLALLVAPVLRWRWQTGADLFG